MSPLCERHGGTIELLIDRLELATVPSVVERKAHGISGQFITGVLAPFAVSPFSSHAERSNTEDLM